MRSGIWQGVAIAIALGGLVVNGTALEARSYGIFHHTIPRETLAMDYRTGDVMKAPPIPYGEYAKDYTGAVHGAAGMTFGAIHGLVGHVKGICSKCGGALCGSCGGKGLFHGKACNDCGGDGCGRCGSGLLGHGGGLLHHGAIGDAGDCASGNCGHGGNHGGLFQHDGSGLGHGGGHLHKVGSGVACVGPGCTTGYAASQAAPAVPAKAAAQVMPSSQGAAVCGGCLGTGRLLQGGGCGTCGGTGRLANLFNHGGNRGQGLGSVCGGCQGRGCGACGGRGLLGNLASKCGQCKGAGCGACGGRGLLHGGKGACHNCGGAGCGLCGHVAGLKGKAHAVLGKLLHKGDIEYFVGPGGPVPITPGYVPYVVSTRSPRDFFAFPPFSDQTP